MTELEKKFLDVMKTVRKLVVPHKTSLTKFRLGEHRDGGYVVADIEGGYDALYSYGCDDNITFEKAFYEKYQKPCYVYDPFKGITNKPDFINFFDEGLLYTDARDKDGRRFGTLDKHIERNGHQNSKNLMAQIDIEGSEWGVFNDKIKYLKNFSQIILEFHLPLDAGYMIRMEEVFKNVFGQLNEDFVCVHFHANNALLQPWVDGYFPRAFELTYVRKDLVADVEVETVPCPIKGLDYACAVERRDLVVDYWLHLEN